jgi:hypothetical protein
LIPPRVASRLQLRLGSQSAYKDCGSLIDYKIPLLSLNRVMLAILSGARKHWRDFSTDAPPMDMQRFMQQVSGNEDLLGVINAMAEIQQRTRDDSRDTAEHAGQLLERLEQFKRRQG